MRRFLTSLVMAAVGTLLATDARAQMVQVGPGYVRAPFVRVYTNPYGGAYVRAPFVNRYTPGFSRRYVDHSPAAAQKDFVQLSWGDLSGEIREACARLDRELERFPSADFWRSSLKIAEISSLVTPHSDAPPSDQARTQLSEIRTTYDSIGATPDFNRVAQLSSFQTLRAALTEYVMLPEPRLRHQLSRAAAELHQSLGRLRTGADWRSYLLVAPQKPLSEDQLRASDDVPTAELADALARYDATSQKENYNFVSNLPAFKTMHARLATYINERQIPSTAPAEELPSPNPVPRR